MSKKNWRFYRKIRDDKAKLFIREMLGVDNVVRIKNETK
jgi:hypothetical protein